MSPADTFGQLWTRIVREAVTDHVDEALVLLKELESTERLGIDELVFKGQLIQQAEAAPGYELEDAKRAFAAALERDEKYPPALIEMGYYCWVMEDDAKQGLAYFDSAIAVIEGLLAEAREGREKCLEELAELAEDE